ncbi:MAG: hypothetical protein MRY72_03270 [Aquisalinus sp.]|nr:hypothetical protein [Aquisalinus sp.]
MSTAKAKKHSKLYRHIETLQGERPWGALLDAGTGVKSVSWVTGLATERWTAVTGAPHFVEQVRQTAGSALRPQDRVVLGNWVDPKLLEGDVYDTVLADYLLGAIEGFAPYFQSYLFKRLRPLTRTTLYVTGIEPYVPTGRPDSRAGQLVWDVGRFRDACVLLKGGMPYREYPSPWVVDQLKRAGFAVTAVKHFTSQYKELFINAQVDIALHGLEALPDTALVQALHGRGEALRAEARDIIKAEGALRTCKNYVVAADPITNG